MNPLNSRRYIDLVDTVNGNRIRILELIDLSIKYLKIKIQETEEQEKMKQMIPSYVLTIEYSKSGQEFYEKYLVSLEKECPIAAMKEILKEENGWQCLHLDTSFYKHIDEDNCIMARFKRLRSVPQQEVAIIQKYITGDERQ